MAEVVIQAVEGEANLETLRTLMREYAKHLRSTPAGAANICIENYAQELAQLPEPYVAVLLAWVDGRAAGCVVLKPLTNVGKPACDLKRLWVRGEFRRLSLGKKLVQAALEQAVLLGCAAVYLDTVPAAMPEANRLYESLEFKPVERYSDNPVPGVVFFRRGLQDIAALMTLWGIWQGTEIAADRKLALASCSRGR